MDRILLSHVVITLAVLHLGWAQKCPYNWYGYSQTSKCFRFVRSTKLTWQDARDYCQTHGGDLLKLESAGERNWVTRQVQDIAKRYSVSSSKWWTGLNNREYLTRWTWADGSPAGNFIPWSPGEPNNARNEERCAEIVSGNKFNDQACSDQDFFICNRPRGLPLACDTDNQWQTLNGLCYKVYTEKQSWTGAQSQCSQDGGSMVVIESAAVESTVHDFASLAKQPMWIGLHSVQVGEGNTWGWSNGPLLTTSTYWHDGTPHVANSQLNSSCVSVSNSLPVSGDWDSESCSTAKAFVCQKPEGVCFNGWVGHSANCYQFDPQFRLPYTAAASFCSKQGAQLLKIDSQTDQLFIRSYLDEFRDSDATTIWLGLSDNNKDTGPYVWRDGKELDSYQYWAYRGNKPINNKGKMDCGYIASTDRYGKWRVTTSCQASRAVICRIPMGMPVKPMPPTPRPRYGCPPNWQLHVDTCFLVGDAPYDQFTARTKCQQYPGADLAVIDSADMQGFVNNMIQTSQNYYIGLNDKSAEGVFVWNDGSDTVSYTNWRPKEPNDYHHQESCVVIYGGAWNDISCNAKAQYVCSLAASEVIHPTPAPTPATDWTVKCGMGWESNPVTEYCYMFSDQPLIWTDALLQCRNNKGNLAYITSLEEQSYMAGRVKQMSSVAVWIGANDRRTENGWAWSSGRGFAYFNWAPGQPDSRTGKVSDCVAILTKTAEWDDLACNKRNGFVCKKKGSVPHTRAPKVTTTALPAGKAWGCGQYWKQWRKSCYAFVNRKSSPVTWSFADTHCRRSGARLVSITSRAEQNYVVSNLPSTNNILDRFWIGMTDIQIENRFLWSDGNDVAYTNWNVGEPNSWKNTNEDCVDIYLRNGKKSAGKWNDQACDRQMQGYICKRPLYIVPASQTANPQFAGCPRGTRGYGPYCYRFYTTTLKTWDDANATCTSAKGELATISDKFVQAFVSSRLVNYNGNAWVGLTDRAQPGVYAWASGHAVSYTAWDRNHTGNERSTCVAMRGSPIKGLWSNQDCGTANGFVCQLPRKGYTVPPTPPTPYPNVPCPMGWTENYAYCLKIFSVTSQKKNWMDAWAFCQALGGDLPSFHEGGNDTVVQTMTGGKFDVWIGLNDRDTEAGHKWSDGSAVDYTNWNPNEPNDWGKDEDCVVLTAGGSWNDLNCFNVNSFLCALPRGTSPMTTLAPPVPVQSSQCGPGWIYYNNNCYLLSATTGENRTLNWYDAQSFCRSRSATLASFHTQQENNLITSVVQTLSSSEIWIGLYMSGNTAFRWTDGSPMDFKFWKVDEPNNYLGGEKCGCMYKWSGKWNDQLCTEKNAYVCKKPLGGVANIIPAPNSPGGCPSGFTRVTGGRNKCYYIVNSVRTNWTDAYAYCRKLGNNVDLASIEDVYEQQFVLTMPTNNGSSLWIGLSDRRGSNRFYWLDNSPVVFTSWDRYQPTSRRVQGKNDTSDCVVTRSSKGHEGRWADRPCSLTKFFLCQTKQDPNIPIGAPPGAGTCRQGYRAYRSGCYRLSSNVLKWADAEGTCQKDGGHLASINDAFEEAFVVTIAASAAPYWIGLSDTKTPGLYYWSDGSRMVYAKWGRREPSYGRQGGGHGCVLSDPRGRWNDTDCSQPIHYVCKISTATVPPTNPSSTGSCADPTWAAVGDYCYYVNVNTGRSWPEANFACQQRGMQMASVHSQKEFQAVVQMVGAAPVKNDQFKPNIWLGMSKDENGAYLWSDGTATNYLSWATGQPSALGPNGTLAECVEFDRTASTWNTAACLLARGFVCKASKVYSTAPMQTVAIGPDGQPIIQPLSQTGDSGSSSGLSGGGVAGIILGLLLGGLLVTFIILYLKRTGKILNNSGGATPSVSVQAGFDNSAYSTEKQDTDI